MIKLVPRSSRKASSKAILAERVNYISDPNDPDHLGKTILPAKNYNCPISSGDASGESFINEVLKLDKAYRNYRNGLRGKRSARLLEEVIYSSQHGAHLTDLERTSIEAMIIQQVGRSTACRAAWHLDITTGRADFHVLLGAKNTDYPPRVTLWADYGGRGGKHIYAEFDRLDNEITSEINKNPYRNDKVKSAAQVRRTTAEKFIGKKDPLWKELADKIPARIDEENIRQAIEALGYRVTKHTRNNISVRFSKNALGPKGKPTKVRRYNIEDLMAGVTAEQELIHERKQEQEKLLGMGIGGKPKSPLPTPPEQRKTISSPLYTFKEPHPKKPYDTTALKELEKRRKSRRYRPSGLEDPQQPN